MTSIKGPHLANLYTEGIPDQARMMKYLEEGVQRGNTHCNSRLGCLAARSGDHKKAKRCFMTAARSGHDKALHNLMVNYRDERVAWYPKMISRQPCVLIRLLMMQERVNPESMRYVTNFKKKNGSRCRSRPWTTRIVSTILYPTITPRWGGIYVSYTMYEYKHIDTTVPPLAHTNK